MTIGYYPMTADILHAGHCIAIEEAKRNCDYLIVGLYCRPTTKNVVQSIYQRYMQLRAVKWIDEIIPYEDEKDAEQLLLSLNYDIYFLGEDYIGKNFPGKSVLIDLQKPIHYLHRKHQLSSSMTKQNVLEKAIDSRHS